MDADEYKAANLLVLITCENIEGFPLVEMARAQAQAEAFGPMLDPTMYIRKSDAFHVDMERTRILRKAQVALQNLRTSHEKVSR